MIWMKEGSFSMFNVISRFNIKKSFSMTGKKLFAKPSFGKKVKKALAEPFKGRGKTVFHRFFSSKPLRCARQFCFRLARAAKRNAGRLAYYGCVAAALTLIALAAENYRSEEAQTADALILPAVELKSASQPAEPIFSIPEGMGQIGYYTLKPQWSETLGQWQSHPAVDYRCADDTVYSVSAGTVRTVGRSGVYGGFVEVETEDYLLRYASVQPDSALEPEKKIDAGERIGVADTSMPAERHMGAHLHLELYRDGESVNLTQEAGILRE